MKGGYTLIGLSEVVKITEIRLSLLKILQSLTDDQDFTKEEAAEDIKTLIREIDHVHYTI